MIEIKRATLKDTAKLTEIQMRTFRHLTIKSWYKKQEFYHGEHRGHREKQENSVSSVPLW